MAVSDTDTCNRLLDTLNRLLAINVAELDTALCHAANAVGDALQADKVDAFLYDETRDSLVAMGTNSTALSNLQKKLGLDVLQVSNGGRCVYVYETGKTFVHGRLQDDPDELRGVKHGMKIQSELGVPLEIDGKRRGMMMIASLQRDYFGPADIEFAESVARWVAVIARHAELSREITRNALEQGRRMVAEELITVLAHDLRNYITPVHARLHLMRARARNDQRKDDVRDTELALKGVERLNQLISDILDVARLDQGMFEIAIEPVDVGGLIQDVTHALSTPEHEILVHVMEHAVVAADPQRIKQCIENIVSNAVQHSSPGSPVNLTVSTQNREGRTWGLLDIHNEGAGIPTEIIPRIFDRFTAGPGSRGLGLGLYLAKRIAVAHGGDLFVESPPGGGTRFRLQLPCYTEIG